MELSEGVYRRCEDYITSLLTAQKKAIRYAVCIFVAILILVIFIYIFKEVPHKEVAKFGITSPKDLAVLENSYRATLAQILGGIAIGIGLYYTWRRVTIAEKELKVSQEGQITERFTRAVDQLGALDQKGNPAIEIRLGGIYALERIANESEKDYWPIMEILTAYVRKNSPVKGEVLELRKLPLDIEAIIIVIGRRKNYFGSGESKKLNLREVCLQMAHLGGANLNGAYFTLANLNGADLARANLKGADLQVADLGGAHLGGANLQGADLGGANLQGADLGGANLSWAYFTWVNLNGANLERATLIGTYLTMANLNGANLRGANVSLDGLSKVKTLYNAKIDDELLIPLKEKHPKLFEPPD